LLRAPSHWLPGRQDSKGRIKFAGGLIEKVIQVDSNNLSGDSFYVLTKDVK
jgi:hypothetical protein